MTDAFGRWLETTLGSRGLVVYDASDPAAKPLVADLFARELETAGTTVRLAKAAGDGLQAKGYHAQAIPHADARSVAALKDDVGANRESKSTEALRIVSPRVASAAYPGFLHIT